MCPASVLVMGRKTGKIVMHVLRHHRWEGPKAQRLQAGALPALPTLSLDGWHLLHLPYRPNLQSFSKLNQILCVSLWGFSLDWVGTSSGWAPEHLQSKAGIFGLCRRLGPSPALSQPISITSKINIFDIKMVEMHPSPSAASIWHTNPQIGCIASLNYLQRIHQGIFSCLKHVFDVVTFIWCFTDPGVAVTAFLDLMF